MPLVSTIDYTIYMNHVVGGFCRKCFHLRTCTVNLRLELLETLAFVASHQQTQSDSPSRLSSSVVAMLTNSLKEPSKEATCNFCTSYAGLWWRYQSLELESYSTWDWIRLHTSNPTPIRTYIPYEQKSTNHIKTSMYVLYRLPTRPMILPCCEKG